MNFSTASCCFTICPLHHYTREGRFHIRAKLSSELSFSYSILCNVCSKHLSIVIPADLFRLRGHWSLRFFLVDRPFPTSQNVDIIVDVDMVCVEGALCKSEACRRWTELKEITKISKVNENLPPFFTYTEWPQKMYTLFTLYFTCQSVYILFGPLCI
jgi:hypothetical protein